MIVTGCMRVKNEARWIQRSIESIQPVCDRIIVFDDHSTDTTAIVAKAAGAVVLDSPYSGLDEVRDKNFLLGAATAEPCDWIIMIDGDEALRPGHALKLQERLRTMRNSGSPIRALAFRVLYLWDSNDQIRTDGVYGNMSRTSAFRPGAERFERTGGANFHCGNCPQAIGPRASAGVSLLHFGYRSAQDRLRKLEWYRANDAHNVMEDDYRHIGIGDIYPSDSRFRHGGPLTLEKL